MRMQFRFELDPVEEIAPWGEGEERKLHWFGLTSGHYWISTPLGEALRYTDEQVKRWGLASPCVDYQVARFFEDLQHVLPNALEPVPSDIAAFVSDTDWFAQVEKWIDSSQNSDERRDLSYDAFEWYHTRSLDTMHMINGPLFHFWRAGDDLSMRWEPTGESPDGVWQVPEGQFSVSIDVFKTAAYTFFDSLLEAMGERITSIQSNGWHRADCKLDIPLLVKEQTQRENWIEELKDRRSETDWDYVRNLIRRLFPAT
jgi:hypothetical protein